MASTSESDLDLDSIYAFALQLGKDAGRMLLEAAQRRMSGDDQLVEEEKANSVDIVTQTDEGELCCWTIEEFFGGFDADLLVCGFKRSKRLFESLSLRNIPSTSTFRDFVRWIDPG
jgi:hypothetical protein